MAQRLVIPSREEVDGELTVAHPWWQFTARFNVAISQSIPVARMHERESEGVMMRWGLAHKDARGTIHLTSCGSLCGEELKSAPDLHRMWMYGQRGIVPLAGFYLWQRAPAGYSQPYYVRLVNRPVAANEPTGVLHNNLDATLGRRIDVGLDLEALPPDYNLKRRNCTASALARCRALMWDEEGGFPLGELSPPWTGGIPRPAGKMSVKKT